MKRGFAVDGRDCSFFQIIQTGCGGGLIAGGSGCFTCVQNVALVTTKFKSGGLHEKHVVITWKVGNHLSICF
jgi:hypothetical protein